MHVVVLGGWAPSLIQFRGPLLAAMVERGHRITAMAPDGTSDLHDRLAAIGVTFEDVALQRTGTDALADALAIAVLYKRLRALKPDLLFAYTIKPVVYGNLAARLAGVPRRHAMITGLGYAFQGQEHIRRRILRRAVSVMYRAALAGADGLFLQNPDDHCDLGDANALPRDLPVTLVRGSGVDIEHYAERSFPAGSPRFVYVGRLVREKGIVEFVEMARRMRAIRPDVTFAAAGWIDPNPASIGRTDLERWIVDGTIEYLGDVPDIRPVLADANVLVLPSYREGTPRSVLEAMSTGRPVIVTDVPGCRETIVDGQHGLVVPVRDPAALVDAALRLLAEHDLPAMGHAARARVEALYDARLVAAQMLDVMGL